MITFKQKGDFSKTTNLFQRIKEFSGTSDLDKYGKMGVEALANATPRDTGKTANSWDYIIEHKKGRSSIIWTNSNIKDGIPIAVANLDSQSGHSAAEAIITTDTSTKEISIEFEIDGVPVVIGAMAKGSGMIHPNMATMLSFITTDLNIDAKLLKEALKSSVDLSYNRVSVDGDSSTNDMVVILANGLAGNATITEKDEKYSIFLEALNTLNIHLAKEIAKDGEGATKLIECNVSGSKDEKSAEILAKSVINSSLVKAAIFGSDANWGRVLCALGYADADFDPNLVSVYFASESDSILVCENGCSVEFDETKAKEILLKDTVKININLHSGNASATAWGCDLTYDYVKINGEYRS